MVFPWVLASIHVFWSGSPSFSVVELEFLIRASFVFARREELQRSRLTKQRTVISREEWLGDLWRAGQRAGKGWKVGIFRFFFEEFLTFWEAVLKSLKSYVGRFGSGFGVLNFKWWRKRCPWIARNGSWPLLWTWPSLSLSLSLLAVMHVYFWSKSSS